MHGDFRPSSKNGSPVKAVQWRGDGSVGVFKMLDRPDRAVDCAGGGPSASLRFALGLVGVPLWGGRKWERLSYLRSISES